MSSIFIPVLPRPASRVRVSKYGNYHLKPYTDFRKEVYLFLKKYQKTYKALGKVEFEVKIEIICKKPKKPTNSFPVPDIDNFVKGYLDSLTYAQLYWEDDKQVVKINASKRYQGEGEDYGANITVKQLTCL